MTSKVIEGHKSSSNFSVNLTLPLLHGPLMLPSPYCSDFSHSQSLLSSPLFRLPSLYIPLYPLFCMRPHEATFISRDF